MAPRTCPTCGMLQTEWLATGGQGYARDGQTFCCRGCAEGSGCTCRTANPGDPALDQRIEEAASALMSPRDRNGRPLDAVESREHAAQLLETAGTARPPRSGPEANRDVESRPSTPDSAPAVETRSRTT